MRVGFAAAILFFEDPIGHSVLHFLQVCLLIGFLLLFFATLFYEVMPSSVLDVQHAKRWSPDICCEWTVWYLNHIHCVCMDVLASPLTAATMNSILWNIYFFHSETSSALEGCVWMMDLWSDLSRQKKMIGGQRNKFCIFTLFASYFFLHLFLPSINPSKSPSLNKHSRSGIFAFHCTSKPVNLRLQFANDCVTPIVAGITGVGFITENFDCGL